MKRTTIYLDLDLLAEASDALGTSGMTETVNGAMADVVRRQKLETLTRTEFHDLDWQTIKAMRPPRTSDDLRD